MDPVNKKKILIIEDDEFFQQMLAKRLQKEFETGSARDSKEAFAFLETNFPDLIILDLILPGLDGFEILTILKKDKRTTGIPVVVLSNLGQAEEIERAKSLGASDFLVKINFTVEEILEKIKGIFKERYL